jgi:hypothetical protein
MYFPAVSSQVFQETQGIGHSAGPGQGQNCSFVHVWEIAYSFFLDKEESGEYLPVFPVGN